MATINVYVPDPLKAEMDAAATSTNWSALCQKTIRQELTRLAATAGDKKTITARVSAAGSKQYINGYAAGKAYAAEHATVDDFEEFDDWYDEFIDQFDSDGGKPADRGIVMATEMAKFFGLDDDYFVKDYRPTWRWSEAFAAAMKDTWEAIKHDVVVDCDPVPGPQSVDPCHKPERKRGLRWGDLNCSDG